MARIVNKSSSLADVSDQETATGFRSVVELNTVTVIGQKKLLNFLL